MTCLHSFCSCAFVAYMYLIWVLIGLLDCPCPLWFARVITLVLQHSIRKTAVTWYLKFHARETFNELTWVSNLQNSSSKYMIVSLCSQRRLELPQNVLSGWGYAIDLHLGCHAQLIFLEVEYVQRRTKLKYQIKQKQMTVFLYRQNVAATWLLITEQLV